jgi:hypothetical protein
MPKSDQGVEQKRYTVVPRTLIFLFDFDNRVLLLKGAENETIVGWSLQWNWWTY